ncbi:MAG: alpha-D-ribose 1-methylphosphonate 5-triphosphate diphosphatase [Pelagimonas sp.]|jgi:alpha-D-ribose 1-methylphosphonate 5-triphosphate diphosphatase|nr:alpha-D-ribose 1-methylphosphonate 5-triphosphate diphosphatase [Pelagimonas sp.]
MTIDCSFHGARVMRAGGWDSGPLHISGGAVVADAPGRAVDLSGYDILPGLVDAHGDGFERHMAPRRGALRERESGVLAVTLELAANGFTTAMLAQFWSWEGGLRGPDFAEEVFANVNAVAPSVPIDLRLQLRLETHLIEDYDRAVAAVERFGISYLVFNDHLPHDRLSQGRKPPRLTGQALKAGRNPDAHFAMLLDLHARGAEVQAALPDLCQRLIAAGVTLGSHDDATAEDRQTWRARGVKVAEFPETQEAAQEAHAAGEPVILGAPNVVRGASHKGNASAQDLIAAGLCDALASDYHYPSPARAAWRCVELGLADEAGAWGMVSSGPARLLGLEDRGVLEEDKRADLVVMERDTRRIVATLAGGQVAWMSGPVAARFFG